ncbi:MAG: hypothetical protein H0V44_03750, partial [Planctomycetes bacterium]|nr:hypothetical protein [Planctomycetota bacterium]
MVTAGMRRYRVRTDLQATLVGPRGRERLNLNELFPGAGPDALLRLEVGFGHGEFISA